jgi:uncharacterized membrane protein (DUF2068 family)
MTDAEHHQQELEQQQQLSERMCHVIEDFGLFHTWAWGSDGTVYITVSTRPLGSTIYLPIEVAKILIKQLEVAIGEAK